MSDVLLQVYIPYVATWILVGVGIVHNNSRIRDLNTTLNKRIDDLRADFSRLENFVVGKVAEVEARLSRIESHLNLH